jgi:hypothetical protein
MLYYKPISFNPLLNKPQIEPYSIYGDQIINFIKEIRNTNDNYDLDTPDYIFKGLKILHDYEYIKDKSHLTFSFTIVVNYNNVKIVDDITNVSKIIGKSLILKLFINNIDENSNLRVEIS